MELPVLYEFLIFLGIFVFCFAVTMLSGPFYNSFVEKDLLSDTEECRPLKGKKDYLILAACAVAVGLMFARTELPYTALFYILMLPALATIVICELKNGFIPAIGTVLVAICSVIKTAFACFYQSSFAPALTAVFGLLLGGLTVIIINIISKKIYKKGFGKSEISFFISIFVASGFFGALIIFFAASLLILLTLALPVWAKRKRAGTPVSEIPYPFSPYVVGCFLLAALCGLFI